MEKNAISNIKQSIITTSAVIILIWVVFFIELLPIFNIENLGIHPRQLIGLIGIFLSPVLHGGFGHIMANTPPLFVLLLLTLLFYKKEASQVVLIIIVLGGFLVWLFGAPNTNHIGASGLIFGLASFLIVIGVLRRNILSIIIAAIVFFLYGSIFFTGIFGSIFSKYISWQGHLFGALSGVLSAFLYKKDSRKDIIKHNTSTDNITNKNNNF